MTLREALEALRIAFDNFEVAVRIDDKTPLQNALALSESRENFATDDQSHKIVVFADINRFRAINTEYGYDAGDAAISRVGIMIKELFVEKFNATAFRQSGDEFVILLQHQYLEKFKLATTSFTSCEVQFNEKAFSIGVSFGCASDDGESGFELIKARAETACKKAKTLGPGSCVEWSDNIELTALESLRDNCGKCGTINACDVPREMNLTKLSLCAACGTAFV